MLAWCPVPFHHVPSRTGYGLLALPPCRELLASNNNAIATAVGVLNCGNMVVSSAFWAIHTDKGPATDLRVFLRFDLACRPRLDIFAGPLHVVPFSSVKPPDDLLADLPLPPSIG